MPKASATSFFEERTNRKNPIQDLDSDLQKALDDYEMESEMEIPDEEYEPEHPPLPEPTYSGVPTVVRSLVIDRKTVKRKRIVLTRSMCRQPNCSYDAAVHMGYPAYKNVPTKRREEIASMLEVHKATAHSFNDGHIIFSGDLQTQFFGVDSKGRPITDIK